jgi:hypothetical protein
LRVVEGNIAMVFPSADLVSVIGCFLARGTRFSIFVRFIMALMFGSLSVGFVVVDFFVFIVVTLNANGNALLDLLVEANVLPLNIRRCD